MFRFLDKQSLFPVVGTQICIVTKHPTAILKAKWNGEHFVVEHWALKKLRPDEVERWDYVGQGS